MPNKVVNFIAFMASPAHTPQAIKQNEPLVRAQGISPMPYKLAAFALGAALTGNGGGIYASHLQIIEPLFLDFYCIKTVLIMLIIGGAGGFWRVVAAGFIMSAKPEVVRFSTDFRMIIFGVVLLLGMLAMPDGVGDGSTHASLPRAWTDLP